MNRTPAARAPAKRPGPLGANGARTALAALSVAMLVVGTLIYIVDRQPGSAAALPASLSLHSGVTRWFGAAGDWLPSFLHAFAFSVLTALVLPRTLSHAAAACAGWALVETAFEVGQHAAVSPWLVQALAPFAGTAPGAIQLQRYFAAGSFDPADVAAGIAGATLAFVVLALIHRITGTEHRAA